MKHAHRLVVIGLALLILYPTLCEATKVVVSRPLEAEEPKPGEPLVHAEISPKVLEDAGARVIAVYPTFVLVDVEETRLGDFSARMRQRALRYSRPPDIPKRVMRQSWLAGWRNRARDGAVCRGQWSRAC